MALHRTAEHVQREIIRRSHAGLDTHALLEETLRRLRTVLPVDAFWCATTDPATLLFTGSVVEGIPESATPRFVVNEFMEDDVNKFRRLARDARPVGSLYTATGGVRECSARFRNILAPLGLGDELRVALKTGSACWGVLCLHRELSPHGFTEEEVRLLLGLAPHLAEGLRTALLIQNPDGAPGADAPGLVLLGEDLSLFAVTPAAERLLPEIADVPRRDELPQALLAVAARVLTLEREPDAAPDPVPRARLRTRAGRMLVAHASRLAGPGAGGQIAVILEAARPVEVAPLLLAAYGLTPREIELAERVLQGRSTAEIAAELVISALTVQQHLKSVFEKVGVRSRRELVAQVFAREYAPRMLAGRPIGADGWFRADGEVSGETRSGW